MKILSCQKIRKINFVRAGYCVAMNGCLYLKTVVAVRQHHEYMYWTRIELTAQSSSPLKLTCSGLDKAGIVLTYRLTVTTNL